LFRLRAPTKLCHYGHIMQIILQAFVWSFSTQHLSMGDFWNEKFRKVIYVRKSAPPIGFNDLGPTRLEEALISRLCRKRIEWSHENEWRFVTGGVGRKHYLEDALQCVYLGPRIEKENADEICNILKRRPVTVMQGFVRGYDLKFETLQTATLLEECERVGGGYFDPASDIFDEQELREFLGGVYNKLVEELAVIALQPNMEQFFWRWNFNISSRNYIFECHV
jgi:hypothetical protein